MICASREGKWELHLSCVRSHGAFTTMLHKIYVSYCYSYMTILLHEHPEVHEFMRNGGFSVQLSNDNTFGRIPVDQTLEEIVVKIRKHLGYQGL